MNPVARRGVVQIEGRLSPAIFKFIAACPGFTKWLGADGVLFEASRKHLELWRERFPDVTIKDADGTLAKLVLSVAPVAAYDRKLTPSVIPFPHQRRGIDVAMSREYYGYFWGMGTGKSHAIVNIMAELFWAKKIERALVIEVKRGMTQLRDEQIPQHMPLHNGKRLRYRAAFIPSTQAVREFKFPGNDLLIGITSPGALQSSRSTQALIDFCKEAPTALFWDESHNGKGWDSLRTNNVWKLRPYCVRRYLFSGEPSPNGYVDLYAQFMLMDPNILGHNSLTSFKNQFAVYGGYKTKEIVEYKNQEELAALIAPHCEFIKLEDVKSDMPKQSWHEAIYEPTDQQRKLYAQLKKEFVIAVEKAVEEKDPILVTRICKNAASKFMALRQVANGWFYANPNEDGTKGELVVLNDERALFTSEVLVGTGNPKTIVFAAFHEDLAGLARAFKAAGYDAVEFSGRLTNAANEASLLRFKNDPGCGPFFGTTASGGTSLNLQVANRTIYHSNTFNWGDRTQSEARTWRVGQEMPCSYWDVFGFPIDRLMRANNTKKRDMNETLRQVTGLAALAEEL